MADTHGYLVDPMAAFYAAVTAVESGSIGEIELMFTNESDETHVAMSISITIRREAQRIPLLMQVPNREE